MDWNCNDHKALCQNLKFLFLQEGSNLCGMAALISWVEPDTDNNTLTRYDSDQERPGGLSALSNWESLARQCDRLIESDFHSGISFPKCVSLACNLDTARSLPMCVQGRLRHGYHFTLKSILRETAVTLVVSKVAGTLVSPERPFAAQGDWLQVGQHFFLKRRGSSKR